MKNFWNEILEFAETTAKRVGDRLLIDFGSATADEKADGSLVTQSDTWADQEIRNAIVSSFPSHGVLSEEGSHTFPDTEWCWIIDPLDATTNFTRGIPIWGISLGLLYHGIPVFGYIHLPPLRQSYHGFLATDQLTISDEDIELFNSMPKGAFLNNQPIQPTADNPSGNHFFNLCSRSVFLASQVPCKVRLLGMASYNFLTVASGAVIGGVEATPKIWDIAGSWVILYAVGGVWKLLNGEEMFPLEVGKNYGKKSYPSLVVSREELVSLFLPIVESLGKKC
jgi:myo-inositol-1(or 4)-monophosphatase